MAHLPHFPFLFRSLLRLRGMRKEACQIPKTSVSRQKVSEKFGSSISFAYLCTHFQSKRCVNKAVMWRSAKPYRAVRLCYAPLRLSAVFPRIFLFPYKIGDPFNGLFFLPPNGSLVTIQWRQCFRPSEALILSNGRAHPPIQAVRFSLCWCHSYSSAFAKVLNWSLLPPLSAIK